MRILLLLFCIHLSVCSFANIDHIDFGKINGNEKYASHYKFVKDNRQYYEHWSAEWNYKVPKGDLIVKLKEAYTAFAGIPANVEATLLTGDVAFYLYNLDVDHYGDSAVKYFDRAIRNAPADYRAYWFLGSHYANSTVVDKGMELFLLAGSMAPEDKPAAFWEEYTFAASLANMPSHAIYSMDQTKKILGGPGSFEVQLGATVRKRIVELDPDLGYTKTDLWKASDAGEKVRFTSRALGMQMNIDSTWGLQVGDYAKHKGVFLVKPPGIKNKNGRSITYSIAIIIKVAGENEKLEDFIDAFIAGFPDKKKTEFSKKYTDMISYELKSADMYKDIGGGHMHMIGIARTAPAYPGLLLESPTPLPKNGEAEQLKFYRANESHDRFKGKIFYAIMLDTCEDIYNESLQVFKKVFEEQLVIE